MHDIQEYQSFSFKEEKGWVFQVIEASSESSAV